MMRFLGPSIVTLSALGIWAAHRPEPTFEAHEKARIQAHFDSVLTELAVARTGLSDVQAARRRELIATLAAYRDRGQFPHNYDVPDRVVPTFVDERTGIRCAVANLLDHTGRQDIVQRVAAANVHVRVAELAADSAFVRWLDQNGLTLAEAARIQPGYSPPPPPKPPVRDHTTGNVSSIALGTGSVAVSAWTLSHLHAPKPSWTTAGAILGGAAFAAGGFFLTARRVDRETGTFAMVSGAGGLLLTALTSPKPKMETASDATANRLSIVPAVGLAASGLRLNLIGTVRVGR